MRSKITAAFLATALAATSVLAASPADAQRWRGHHGGWHHRHHHGGSGGAFIGGLAAGAILGGALASSPRRYYSNDAVEYCMSRFRSYDPASGTYLGYDGQRHACP